MKKRGLVLLLRKQSAAALPKPAPKEPHTHLAVIEHVMLTGGR